MYLHNLAAGRVFIRAQVDSLTVFRSDKWGGKEMRGSLTISWLKVYHKHKLSHKQRSLPQLSKPNSLIRSPGPRPLSAFSKRIYTPKKLNGFKLATNIANEWSHKTRPGPGPQLDTRATRAPAGNVPFDLPIQVPWQARFSVGLALGLVPPNVESILMWLLYRETKTKVTSTALQRLVLTEHTCLFVTKLPYTTYIYLGIRLHALVILKIWTEVGVDMPWQHLSNR